ncbi:MAG: prepilin-type N-terminal cleavage/methylation domain-containing protein [Pirellulaceae bacterium]|nr:prepilin-type N-terminal cleavage/methylation domain-containing protein [Pirellulaceae bacterium]
MKQRKGYTLVEMLLATALSAALLVALWTLMSTYGELFDKGQQQVERAQLSRAILEQMADDLRSAIQDPLPGQVNETAGVAQRRRFGLFGSARELRFDVLQLTPQQGNPLPVGRAAGRSVETQAARVPELRTVHYTFFEPNAGDELSEPGRQGLVRSELDFETPLDSSATEGLAAELPKPDELADPDARSSVERFDGERESAADDARLSVPEVVSLQFRYFDGRGWTDAWNSLDRKSLPAAVEIELQLAEPSRVTSARPADAGLGPSDDQDLALEATGDATSSADTDQDLPDGPRVLVIHRLIVDLPGSPNYRPPASEPQSSVPPSVRPPVRRIAPPRWTPSAKPAALPEDWIRTGSR